MILAWFHLQIYNTVLIEYPAVMRQMIPVESSRLAIPLLIGYPWAILAWKDSAWWWDPKISGSIMMWVLYSAYLHSRIYVSKGKMWETTAYLGIICFTSLIFTYLLTYIVPGIHSVVQP